MTDINIISRKEAKEQGLPYYYIGIECINGHLSKKRTSNSRCFECEKLQGRSWKKKNPEKEKEHRRQTYYKHQEKNIEASKRWIRNNKEKASEAQRKRRRENPEKFAEKERLRYQRDRENILARHRQWTKDNSSHVNAYNRVRSVERFQRIPSWADLNVIEKFYEEAKRLTKETGVKYHVDHIIPLRGKLVSGLHVETNLRVIPAVENLSKQNKLIFELTEVPHQNVQSSSRTAREIQA